MNTSLKLMIFLWKIGFIDTFSLMQFFVNTGVEYSGVVVASAAGNFSQIKSAALLKPIHGLHISYQFVKSAKTVAEKWACIATLAALLFTSISSAATLDPSTNGAVASVIASKIRYMIAILDRNEIKFNKLNYLTLFKKYSVIYNPMEAKILNHYMHKKN